MGDCADDILATLRLDETKATYDEVHTALNGYFDVRRNLIVQQALFNKRHQLAGEPVDTFIQNLYRLAEDLEDVEVPFLGEVYSREADFWTAIVKVNGHETHFTLDTGAAVSIVSDKEPWLKDHQLTKLQQILRGPGGTILSVVGTFRATPQQESMCGPGFNRSNWRGEHSASEFHWRVSSAFPWSGETEN